jgi:hypothetical protein
VAESGWEGADAEGIGCDGVDCEVDCIAGNEVVGVDGFVVALFQLGSTLGARFCSCFTLRKKPTGQSSRRNHSSSFSESSNLNSMLDKAFQ